MERKIGEIFEHNGEWYQCVEDKSCNGCAFKDTKCGDISNIKGYCSVRNRSVKKSVIFKKLEKVGEPYMDGGKIMQKYKRVYREPIYFPYKELNCYNDLHGRICIEIKQTNEDMEEKNNVNTPLNVLTDKYVNGDICYDDFEKEVKALYSCKEEIKPTLKEFDLEAAKLGKPVCTRDGRKARIICFDRIDSTGLNLPIVALIQCEGTEVLQLYRDDGKRNVKVDLALDLMMLPEKKDGWVNIDKGGSGKITISSPYSTKEEAIHNDNETTIDTVKIYWEE